MNSSQISEIVEEVVKKHQAMQDITLETAKRLAAKVEEKAAAMGVKAVAVIMNRGANPVLVHCMDDSFIASYDVAFNKAYTAVALKTSTAELKKLAQPGGSLYGVQNTNGGRIVIFGGGEPLTAGGRIVGGLGVSGGTEDEDGALAAYGKQLFDSFW